jgi:uncharacterized SAM-binding protein YcdF (DUF218 family)
MIVRFFKWSALLALLVLIAIASYGVHLYNEIRDSAVHDEAQAADAIVVLGAAQYNGHPSPVLKARLDHVLFLYDKGYAKSIITTGSYGPDENFSEAHVSTQYLIQHGVDADHIITQQGGSTHDSIRAATVVMRAKSWKSALVVSDGFHLFRSRKMFEDEGVIAYTSPVPNSPIEVASSQRFWFSMREVMLFCAYRLIKV